MCILYMDWAYCLQSTKWINSNNNNKNNEQRKAYSVFNAFACLRASPGTARRPQLCINKRFSLFNPINASESIFDILLSDKILK